MALISCPECHDSVSDSASSCPKCGFRLSVKIQGTKTSVVGEREEIENRKTRAPGLVRERLQSHRIGGVSGKTFLSSLMIGFTAVILMWSCSNYIIYVPSAVFGIFSELQTIGKFLSNLVIVVAARSDFQGAVDALESFKYLEILINGIVFGCVIYLIRLAVERIGSRRGLRACS